MALPSQSARASGGGRVYTSRRPIRLTPQVVAIVVVGAVVVVALASWGLGAIGKGGEGPKNEPVDTSVKSEPVPEERPMRLTGGPASADAAEPSRTGSRLARQPNTEPGTSPNTGSSRPTTALLPPTSSTPTSTPGDQPLQITQSRPAESGPLSRAIEAQQEPTSQPRPADPNVITPLPNAKPSGASTQPTQTPADPALGLIGNQPSTQPEGTNAGNNQPASQPTQPVAPPSPTAAADEKIRSGDLVAARKILSQVLAAPSTPESERAAIRARLGALNEDLVFSPKVYAGDTFVETYTVQSGDALAKIASKRDLATDWRLIQRVNRLSNPNRISVGQKLKLVRGPFHAVVTKSAYRLDLYMGSPDEPSSWVFVKAYTVGLGEGNGTPVGTFVVKKNSKLVNPYWVNPRTGEKFDADDPKNPIGEHWIGIEGVGESAPYVGYGLHGTVDPDSIGKQRSMGCVRMHTEDIAQVYELLVEGVSVVKILP